ncbi:MAG TPA: CRTAC1 family protein [Steroidobacteraceae bacterium]|nr:CRTAC1 family protein [Steroidobacteraceae bacterium]
MDSNCIVHVAAARPARLVAALCCAVFVAPASQAAISFSDVSAAAGVDRRGESYGASWGDLNGDGFPDLFASNHREQPSLFLNLGNGRFYETGPNVLVWRNRARADTHGGSWADYDNDGDLDLMVTTGTGNLSQFLVNEHQRLVDRSAELGFNTSNVGGRLPVWLDYDGDKRSDVTNTQYGGIAKLYNQNAGGTFAETTGTAKLICNRVHYGHLYDVTGDGRLEFICPGEAQFPQKIYDTASIPWTKLFDVTAPNGLFPVVQKVVESVLADFDNDGRLDMFLLSGVQLRPASVVSGGSNHFEAQLTGGTKGFKFVSGGRVTIDVAWNKTDNDTTVDYKKIQVGAGAINPTTMPFTLDAADPRVAGFPPAPTLESQLPLMQVGYDPGTQRWTVVIQTKLSPTSKNIFSEAYVQVDTEKAYSGLVSTGFWPSDKAARPTLLMNRSGGHVDATVAAGLGAPVQCVSATPGDFDNDGDIDLYLACRTGASNLPNVLYENKGTGTFQMVANAGGAAGPVGIAVASGAGTADSVVSADYDMDGFLDLFVTNGFNLRPLGFGGANKLFRNQGNGNHWVQVDLAATQSDRAAVGARVYAMTSGLTQMRVQDGSYHRWSQDMPRAHFGLGSATLVNLRVEWPSGNVQTFNGVAVDRLYRITEAGGIAAIVPGNALPYQCGPPTINGATDSGVFIWRDCPTGEWRLKVASAGASINYRGTITSGASFTSVKPQSLEADDSVGWTSNSSQITFNFMQKWNGTDGVNFTPQDRRSACLRIDAPTGAKVYYGPFRKLVTAPIDLNTRGPC